MDFLLIAGLFCPISVVAVLLLGWRDARRRRLQESRRPLAERIRSIREDAEFMVVQLQGVLDRAANDRPEAAAWISPVLEFFRRLESLAADPSASPDAALRLATEASRYVREHWLKGILVAEQARTLADLLRQRDGV
jgi:hypothetical protein